MYRSNNSRESAEWSQSTLAKKMAAVQSTTATTPCDPNTAYEAQRKPNFYNVCPCAKDIGVAYVLAFHNFSVHFYKRC